MNMSINNNFKKMNKTKPSFQSELQADRKLQDRKNKQNIKQARNNKAYFSAMEIV